MTARKSIPTLPAATVDAIAEAVQPAELGAERRERLRRRVLKAAREATADGTVTIRSADAVWVKIAPLVEARELSRDERNGTHVSLMRMHPGGIVPAHRHSKEEHFFVLEGECHIGTHLLRAGDSHVAAAGSLHGAVTTQRGVLVLLRGEYPYPAAHD